MKRILMAAALAGASGAFAADPPAKKSGGFFGFGAPQGPQISSALFPDGNAPVAPVVETSPPKKEGGIFRSGKPQPPAATSYVIENGQRVEKPLPAETKPATPPPPAPTVATPSTPTENVAVPLAESIDRKRSGFLGFGRRDGSSPAPDPSNEPSLATPVIPSSAPTPTARPIATPAKPAATTPPAPVPTLATVAEPAPSGARQGFTSRIPFLNRRKSEEPGPVAAPPIAAMPVEEKPQLAAVPVKPAPAPKPAAAPKPSSPAPATAAPEPAATESGEKPPAEVASFEIRRDDSKSEEPKKDGKPGFVPSLPSLPSLPRITPPRKELDLSQAETLISNGEIVREAGSTPMADSGQAAGPRQAPQVVNGVKTYSSWDDVEAKPSSAAEKIISSIR
jgi:hypothetical protein